MRPGASIINVGSVNSFDASMELLDYGSTKGAIHQFTRALSKQLASKGIRVNMVAPGPFWTPLQVCGGQLPGKLGEFGHDPERPLERACDVLRAKWASHLPHASSSEMSSAPSRLKSTYGARCR